MKIIHISDTHGHHNELSPLPAADVIVHSGDFTFAGNEEEAYDFMSWFCDLHYKHKIFISGNHDMCMYGADSIDGLPPNVHYLNNSGITIEGVKFYGVPLFVEDASSGKTDVDILNIPADTEVLVTHQPPYSYCDMADYGNGLEHRGNPRLAARVAEMHLRCHLFGHEHDAYGVEWHNGVVFSNASVLDNAYNPAGKPRIIEI